MKSPTTGELKIMFDNLSEKIDNRHQEVMELLKEVRDDGKDTKQQALMTNGRVSKLEFWKAAIIWAIGAILAVIGAILPILRSIVQHEIQLSVNQSVVSALSQYDIKIVN